MGSDDKVIVTNRGALAGKYGRTGAARIDRALAALARADAARGLTTTVVALDRAGDVPGGGRVDRPDDERAVKAAIDAICARDEPAYLAILGAPDIVPHQRLRNPVGEADDDPDADVPSDLPYACPVAFTRQPERLLGPTRVVGRIPDVPGASDEGDLLGVIEAAAAARTRRVGAARRYFALTAATWQRSSRTTVTHVFGDADGLRLSPPDGPRWTRADLARPVIFFNCHGAPADPMFYGEDGRGRQPDAFVSTELAGRVRPGAVAAAECCYGAELYDPEAYGVAMGVANRFLAEGGAGYLGSTTVAYGPAAGNDMADLMCRFFLESLLAGASLGRALLEARQRYLREAAPIGAIDLKTLAQFHLLGDPSIHPFFPSDPTRPFNSLRLTRPKSSDRAVRRHVLAVHGRDLLRQTPRVASRPDAPTSTRVREALYEAAVRQGFEPRQALAFLVHPAPGQTSGSLGRYHVAFARPHRLAVGTLNGVAVEAYEASGQMSRPRVVRQR